MGTMVRNRSGIITHSFVTILIPLKGDKVENQY